MAYQSTKPAATDRLKDSQGDIQQNFADIKTAFDVNHEALTGAGGNEGKHKFLQMPRQVADPATSGTEMALYTKLSATTGFTELYLRNQSNGTVIGISEHRRATDGFARFAGGILYKWGEIVSSETFAAVAFPENAAIPVFTAAPYHVMVTPIYPGGGTRRLISSVVAWTATTITISCVDENGNGVANGHKFIAIGPG